MGSLCDTGSEGDGLIIVAQAFSSPKQPVVVILGGSR